MSDEGYNGWANWDTWAVSLVLDNTQGTYRWIHEDWKNNFQKKIKSGKFNQALAEKVVEKYIIPVARGKGMASRFKMDGGIEPDIDPKKVDKAEIVKWILEDV